MGLNATCWTADLVRELTAVSKAASKKSTWPILGNVLIEATTGEVRLSCTDLTSWLQAVVPATVTEPGSTTVTISELTHLVGQFEKGSKAGFFLDPEMDANHLVIADGQGTAGTLRIIDPDEMPGRPDTTKWTVMGRMSTRVLADMIVRAIPFCADDMARQILTGVKVRTSADKITFAAADNYVITCLDGVLYDGAEATVAVPAASLKLLGGLLSDDNDITLRVDGTRFNVAWGQYDLTIAGIDGQFPNYEQVIPRYSPWDGEAGSYGITVDRKALLKALKLTRKCDPIVHVVTGGESITVKIPDPNDGAYETLFAKSLPATVTPAQDVRIGFNPALLTLVLNTIAAPTVTLFRNDPGVLVAFGIDTGDPSSRYAVMPVKLGNL